MKNSPVLMALALICGFQYINSQNMERKKPNIEATYHIEIIAPIQEVWEALAVDYGGIGKWASGVNHVVESRGSGSTAKRFCSISAAGFNDTRERIITWEPENHYFEYELYEGLPGFVRYSINKDQLTAKGDKTIWTSHNVMRVGGIVGATMKWMMRGQLRKVLQEKGEELKHFIETGSPHPRKVKIMAEKASKDAKMRKKVVSFVVEQEVKASVARVWEVYGPGFADIYKSNPNCPFSEWSPGHYEAGEGAMRIMYMTKRKDKKYFVDKIAKYEPDNRHITIEIVDKKGFGNLNHNYTWVNIDSKALGDAKTLLKIRFTYLTKPRFLKGMAKGSLKRAFEDYAQGIAHYAQTGEPVSKANWNSIKRNYR